MLCVGAGGLGLARGAVPGGRRRRHARHRRLRRRRLRATCSGRSCTARATSAARSCSRRSDRLSALNPEVQHRDLRDGADVGERARDLSRTTTSSSTAPTISRRGISSTTRACSSASRTPTAASSASRGRRRCSPRKGGPCYRCLYPEPPPPGLVPSCAEGGVLGVLPGVIGTIQATEAIKLILGAARRWSAGCCSTTRGTCGSASSSCGAIRQCPVCGDHPTVQGADRLRPVLRHRAAPAAPRRRPPATPVPEVDGRRN